MRPIRGREATGFVRSDDVAGMGGGVHFAESADVQESGNRPARTREATGFVRPDQQLSGHGAPGGVQFAEDVEVEERQPDGAGGELRSTRDRLATPFLSL